MKSNKYIPILLGVVLCLCPAARSNIINGGFETTGLTPWTASGEVYVRDWEMSRDFLLPIAPDWTAREGNYFASLWTDDGPFSVTSTLSQTFDVEFVGDTLSFEAFFDNGEWFEYGASDTAKAELFDSDGGLVHTFFQYDTASMFDLADPAFPDDVDIPWTEYSYEFMAAGDDYTLIFTVSGNPLLGGFESILGVDNVNVVPIPAPAAILLGTIGMGLVGLLRRRRML
jgi:hypothetical protein